MLFSRLRIKAWHNKACVSLRAGQVAAFIFETGSKYRSNDEEIVF